MNTYKCLKKQIYQLEGYSIIALREQDIFFIMKWRNEQIKVLRQNKILTREKQQKYYYEAIKPTFFVDYPEQILFSYLYNNECIGYGGIVHINWHDKKGEISFLASAERMKDNELYKKDFSVYLSLIKEVAFTELNLNRLHVETFDIREYHIKILEMNGFVFEGRMRESVFIENKFVDSLIHGCLKKNYIQ